MGPALATVQDAQFGVRDTVGGPCLRGGCDVADLTADDQGRHGDPREHVPPVLHDVVQQEACSPGHGEEEVLLVEPLQVLRGMSSVSMEVRKSSRAASESRDSIAWAKSAAPL